MKKRSEIIMAASVVITCMGVPYISLPALAAPVITQEVAQNESMYETESWKKVENRWDSMDKVKVENFGEISGAVSKEKEAMSKILDVLIIGAYISETEKEAINLIYGENLRGVLDGKVELPCCYAPIPPPPQWDCTGIDTREDLEKKLALVEELYNTGTVEKDVLDEAKKDIKNRLNLLDKADAYWQDKGEGTCRDHPAEVDIILHLYDRNTGGIKEGKPVKTDLIKASEHILKLEGKD